MDRSGVIFVIFLTSFCWSTFATDTHPNLNHIHSIVRTNEWKIYITNIAADSKDSVIAVGYGNQPFIFNSPFISKYNSQLVLEWDLSISDSFGEKLFVRLDEEDNIYVAGYFGKMKSSLTVANNPKNDSHRSVSTKGENDIFVLKLDTNGNLIWLTSFGTEAEEIIGNFYVSPRGQIALVGVQGYDQWFVTRLDSDGSVVWEKPMGNTGGWYTNNAFAVALDSNDNPIVSHSYTEPKKLLGQELPYKEKYQHNGLMIKLDSGEIEWYQTWHLPKLESTDQLISREFTVMEIDAEGNIYAIGKDSINIPLGGIIAKVSSNGEKLWEIKVEGWVEDIEIGSDGNIYAVGSYSESYLETAAWGVSQPTLPPSRRSAAFVIKMSPGGHIIWKNSFGGSKWIAGNSIAMLTDNKVVISFGFSNEANFGGEVFKTKANKEFTYISGVLAIYSQTDSPKKPAISSNKEEL